MNLSWSFINSKMVGKLFHLIAYSQTGKDTLVNQLAQKRPHNWLIYGKDGQSLALPNEHIKRVAYADQLKLVICNNLKFPNEWVTDGTFDKYKDVSGNSCPEEIRRGIRAYSEEVDTLRDICRDMADELKRIHGQTHFVDLAKDEIDSLLSQDQNVFVTDTRYPFEIFDNGITVRMFRHEVPIAPKEIHSERSLDDYQCDFVLCQTEIDFLKLKRIQPQYEKYTRVNGAIQSC